MPKHARLEALVLETVVLEALVLETGRGAPSVLETWRVVDGAPDLQNTGGSAGGLQKLGRGWRRRGG